LRTPLTVINGYIETLLDSDLSKNTQFANQFKQMMLQADRMKKMVNGLLLLSKLETKSNGSQNTVVSIPSLIASLKEETAILSDGAHMVQFDIDDGLWLRGDYDELQSAFTNLISNAIRYTPEGGEIWVRWYQDEDGAHFSVRDTGMGIPAHAIPRLTERFFRTDKARSRETGGSGLGLAIVKHVLSRHHAQLRINSTEGKGSEFVCDFPPEQITKAAQRAS
jgi:two-component system phosphate regulon sensor histidine kinase PhoR